MSGNECVFCRIAKQEIPAKIIFKDKGIVAFEDIRPQAPVHIVVIPEHHIERVSDLREGNSDLIGRMILAAGKLAGDRGVRESGYRIVLNCNADAGQEVFHLHLHLLGGRKFTWPPG
jgi:histidine triad (HIT) family protein